MNSFCNFPLFILGLSLPSFPGFNLPAIPNFSLSFSLPCPLD
jgi:hypothetical protein